MKSTSASEAILKITDMSLNFNADVYRLRSLRELFINAVRKPEDVFGKKYRMLKIIKNLNFTVNRGERIGLLGVNGTGKTSFCRCISGIYKPTSGTVEVMGKIRAIFDPGIATHPELTGRENAQLLVHFLYPDHVHEYEEIISDALSFSELGDFLDVPYRLYSTGMQVRLCLSLLSARPTDLLILDEVYDGADSFFKKKISERILKMIECSGAVIFVSHEADQLRRVCNRLVILNNGEIIFDGDVDVGIAKYQSLTPKTEMLFQAQP